MDDKYSHLLSAYQMTGSAKVKGTVEFLETLVDSKVKFIVFCHHYEVMDQVEDSIVKKKIPYIAMILELSSFSSFFASFSIDINYNI